MAGKGSPGGVIWTKNGTETFYACKIDTIRYTIPHTLDAIGEITPSGFPLQEDLKEITTIHPPTSRQFTFQLSEAIDKYERLNQLGVYHPKNNEEEYDELVEYDNDKCAPQEPEHCV